MITSTELAALGQLAGAGHLAIGVFDGIHRGHQCVIGQALHLRDAARESGQAAWTGVVTFDPHPIMILRPDEAPPRLMTSQQQTDLLAEMGVDLLITLPFTPELAQQEATAFAHDLQRATPSLHSISVGESWRFGHRAAGTVSLLQQLGLTVRPVAPVYLDDLPVSSTRVRESLLAADPETAERLLGRHWSTRGEVIHGFKLGRELGFPTANLQPVADLPMGHGVYVVRGQLPDEDRDLGWGVANYGRRPTISAHLPPLLEAFFLNSPGDLYGRNLEVEFWHFLRSERSYPHVDALRDQVHQDIDNARDWIAERGV